MPQSTPQEFPGWLAGTDPRREGHGKWNVYTLQRNGLVTRVLRAQHTGLTKDPLDEPSLNPSTPLTSRPGEQSRVGLCPRSDSEDQDLKPSQRLQGSFFAHCTNMCICLWVLIPFKGPPPAPHFPWHCLYPRTCSFWLAWAFCWLFPLLKPLPLPLTPPSPLSHLANSYTHFRAQPTASFSSKKAFLLFHHEVLLNHNDWELLEGRKPPLSLNSDVISIYQ